MTAKYVQYGRLRYKILRFKDGRSRLEIVKRGILDIAEIIGLNEQIELKELDLSNNKIKSFNGLENLVNLRILRLSSNQISEISGLERLVNLEELYLNENQIKEINGLENLTNLRILDLNNNQLNELKGLENLTNLRVLDLNNNQINELKGLQNLENLKDFVVNKNPLDDWMKKNFGRGPYGHILVEYCRKMMEGEDYDSSRVEGLLDQTTKEIENIIKTTPPELGKKKLMKTYDTIIGLLEDIHGKVYDPTIFYDFLGNLLTRNLEFFDARFSYAFNSKVAGWESQKLDMESYILEKYCFFEGEFFISKFYGTIAQWVGLDSAVLKGRLYVTNYRIIGHGTYRRNDALDIFWTSNVPNLARFSYSSSKPIFEDIQKFSGKDMKYKALPIFGFQYPILNVKNARLRKKFLKFKSDHRYFISITKSFDETYRKYIERTHTILNLIYKNLMEIQK